MPVPVSVLSLARYQSLVQPLKKPKLQTHASFLEALGFMPFPNHIDLCWPHQTPPHPVVTFYFSSPHAAKLYWFSQCSKWSKAGTNLSVSLLKSQNSRHTLHSSPSLLRKKSQVMQLLPITLSHVDYSKPPADFLDLIAPQASRLLFCQSSGWSETQTTSFDISLKSQNIGGMLHSLPFLQRRSDGPGFYSLILSWAGLQEVLMQIKWNRSSYPIQCGCSWLCTTLDYWNFLTESWNSHKVTYILILLLNLFAREHGLVLLILPSC